MSVRLPDFFLFLWLLFSVATGFLKGIVEIKFLLVISLTSACYIFGRCMSNLELLKRVTTFLIIINAVVCFYYLYKDATIFQENTFVSQNSSMMAIQIAILASLTVFILSHAQSQKLKITLFLCLAVFLFLLMILQSRTTVIAFAVAILYVFYPKWRSVYSQKQILFIAGATLIGIIFLLAVFVKIGSSHGRWFIWKNSFQLFKNNWLKGTGTGLFNPSYNHLQAEYFSKNSLTDANAMLANDGYFAFNEWLHIGIEQGIVGLLFFMIVTGIFLFACLKAVKSKNNFPEIFLILVAVASFFSYPLHNWIILSITLFFSGIIGRQTRAISSIKITMKMAVGSIVIITVLLLYTATCWLNAISNFEKAKRLQEDGFKTEAYILSFKSKSILKTHPGFTLFYLNLLYETGRIEEAIQWESMFQKYHCNQKAHAIIAKCFSEIGNISEAEKHLYISLYITPHLLQSRMDFVEFYNKNGQIGKAKYWAQQLLDCPVKIPTDRAWYLKNKAKEFLNEH